LYFKHVYIIFISIMCTYMQYLVVPMYLLTNLIVWLESVSYLCFHIVSSVCLLAAAFRQIVTNVMNERNSTVHQWYPITVYLWLLCAMEWRTVVAVKMKILHCVLEIITTVSWKNFCLCYFDDKADIFINQQHASM